MPAVAVAANPRKLVTRFRGKPPPNPGIKPPKLDPTADETDQFTQLSGSDALAHLVKILSYPLPGSVGRSIAREVALEKIQARYFQARGLDGKGGLTLNVAVMSDAAVQPQERIADRITPSQVVDVQCVASDMTSECVDGGGI